MPKFITLLVLPFIVTAQNTTDNLSPDEQAIKGHHQYVSTENGKIYDIEIIIFAYKNALPNANTYQDKFTINHDNALWLQPKPADLMETLSNGSMVQDQQNLANNSHSSQDNTKEYTVNIGETTDKQKILAWFQHNPQHHKLSAIWQRLLKNSNIVPLSHQNWRQQQTAFDSPVYVNIGHQNNSNNPIEADSEMSVEDDFSTTENSNNSLDALILTEQEVFPDFHLTGKVALSKGRFIHFSNHLKLYRQYYDGDGYLKNMTFSLQERRQIKPNELHYFDSPWLGSIVKVTEFTGKTDHE